MVDRILIVLTGGARILRKCSCNDGGDPVFMRIRLRHIYVATRFITGATMTYMIIFLIIQAITTDSFWRAAISVGLAAVGAYALTGDVSALRGLARDREQRHLYRVLERWVDRARAENSAAAGSLAQGGVGVLPARLPPLPARRLMSCATRLAATSITQTR